MERFHIGKVWLAHQRAAREPFDIGDAVVEPLAIVPIGHVDGGEQADALEIDAAVHRGEAFADDVVEPVRPSAFEARCFGDDARAAIGPGAFLDEVTERPDPVVSRLESDVRSLLAIFHLAEAVIVEAENIEDLGAAAELGIASS
jgi:hypothetical protein